ncbi:hypothetical protein JHK82_021237 [Glycine max]|nr:hypothetical protein JHK82_021237 [Glycine max]
METHSTIDQPLKTAWSLICRNLNRIRSINRKRGGNQKKKPLASLGMEDNKRKADIALDTSCRKQVT